MKKLSKGQLAEKAKLYEALAKAKDALDGAVDEFNGELEVLFSRLRQNELAAYNEAVQAANEWAEQISIEITEAYDAKSERWQEGGAAQAIADWRDEFECQLDELEADEPTPLELDTDLSTFESLRDGADD